MSLHPYNHRQVLEPTSGSLRRPGWGLRIGFLLFFLMLFTPTTYQSAKAVLLVLTLAAVAARALWRGRLALHRTILLWSLFLAAVGLVFIIRGVAHGAPGAVRVGTVYVLWPLVYTVLIAGVPSEAVLAGTFRVLVAATVAIGLYGFSYILHAARWLPDTLYLPIDQGQAIGFYEGYVEFNLYSLASLLFLVPFIVAALLTWPKSKTPVSRLWLWTALILGVGLVTLSARRALLLVVGTSPIVALVLRRLLAPHDRRASRKLVLHFLAIGAVAVAGIGFFLHAVYGFTFAAVTDMFKQGFAFESYARALPRKEQFLNLMAEWSESPLLGAGHGAAAAGWLRSEESPWAYELSYVALLFHTGLVGFTAYAGGVVWILWKGLRVLRSGARLGLYVLPVLVGTICFLIANATNPYLEKYDYMWVIFLPLALVNVWLLQRERAYSNIGPRPPEARS